MSQQINLYRKVKKNRQRLVFAKNKCLDYCKYLKLFLHMIKISRKHKKVLFLKIYKII